MCIPVNFRHPNTSRTVGDGAGSSKPFPPRQRTIGWMTSVYSKPSLYFNPTNNIDRCRFRSLKCMLLIDDIGLGSSDGFGSMHPSDFRYPKFSVRCYCFHPSVRSTVLRLTLLPCLHPSVGIWSIHLLLLCFHSLEQYVKFIREEDTVCLWKFKSTVYAAWWNYFN